MMGGTFHTPDNVEESEWKEINPFPIMDYDSIVLIFLDFIG
jgi:hypothetical protein